MAYDLDREIREAITAGEYALSSLREAQQYLGSARGWGVIDILGGGLLTNLIKHSKLDKARRCMELARQDLRRFQRELEDVDAYLPDINVGDFMTFADFFFDGFLADVLMQSKIAEARRNVEDAIYRVESVVSRLRMELR